MIAQFIRQHAHDGRSEVQRATHCFAVIAAAGELANSIGVTGWQKGEAALAVLKCFKVLLAEHAGEGFDVNAAVRHVHLFMQLHGGSRFQSVEETYHAAGSIGELRVKNGVGYKRNIRQNRQT